MTRNLYPSEIVKRFEAMAKRWPKNLAVWSDAGSLLIVDMDKNYRVIEIIIGIPSDGGDSGTHYGDDGHEYLNLDW